MQVCCSLSVYNALLCLFHVAVETNFLTMCLKIQFNSMKNRKYKNTVALRKPYVQLYLEHHSSQWPGNTLVDSA